MNPISENSARDHPNLDQDFDCTMMQRCLALARQALGQTAPNPLVGCVIVQQGKIISGGFHPKAGEPHAEIFALRQAGATLDPTLDATLYVNLEPCNHHGRTPPCTEAIIAAGIKRVVVGMIDPNPKVAGSGIDRLRSAGIAVSVGIEEPACEELNEAFVHRILHQTPFGILKYAMTLDGKIATTTRHSAWVTGAAARGKVHQIRAGCDAIVVGGNTVRSDDPLLTSRQPGRTPLRVVMSRSLDLPTHANLWNTAIAPTVLFAPPKNRPEFQEFLKRQGVEVVELEPLTPAMVMANLYDRGHLSVLWECGGVLAARAIADGAVQKILAFIAPKIIGGYNAPSPIGDLGLTKMTDALSLERIHLQSIGTDLLVEGYLKRKND